MTFFKIEKVKYFGFFFILEENFKNSKINCVKIKKEIVYPKAICFQINSKQFSFKKTKKIKYTSFPSFFSQ